MLDFTYENQGSHTYLVYKFGEETIDTMILGMLTNNKIKGFAKPIYTEVNGEKFIKYNISAKISLDKLFLGSVNKNRILKIFINILDGLTRVDDYMLDTQHVLIDKDYIFADVSTSDVAMVCMPIVDYDSGVNLKEFFKNTIFSLSYDASENGDYIAKMIAYLNNDMNFTIEGFKEHLEGLLGGGTSAPAAPQYGNYNQSMAPAQPAYSAPAQQPMMGTPAPMAPSAPAPVAPAAPVAPQAVDPNIQNVVNSSKSAKMVKRNEMLEAQQAELEKKNRIDLPPIGNNNSGMGFEIPGMGPAPIGGPAAAPVKPKKEKAPKEKKSKAKAAPAAAAPAASSEDDVSLMYLLQHYNKENAAKYKATKERKKNGGNAQAAATVAAPQAPARPQMQAPQAPAMPQMQAPQAPAMPQMQAPQAPAMPQMQAPQAPVMPQAQPMQQVTQMQQTQMMPQTQPAAPAPAPAAPQFTPVQQQAPAMPQFTHIQQQQAAPKAAPAPAPAPETPSMASMLGNNETTVLTSGVVLQTRPFLYRFKDGEKIFINKNTYKVGKSADVVDYCIEDNTAISRCHAIFYKIEDKYYVEDLNSTNGTYVDDEKITSNKKIPIRVGSRIKFANDEYELRFE